MTGGDTPRDDGNGPSKQPRRARRKRGGDANLKAPTLGYIPATPDSPSPTLAEPSGDAASAYVQALDRLQAATSARILLVTGTSDAPGRAPAALNLGVAATRLGLRTAIIDGDSTGLGPTQFLRTGTGPGLADLAAGTAGLAEASRLLTIDANNRFPIIPAGATESSEGFEATDLADPIDAISEHADLVLINAPASEPDDRLAALGAHADGAVLVVEEKASPRARVEAAERLASFGAPVVGLIEMAKAKRRKRRKRES